MKIEELNKKKNKLDEWEEKHPILSNILALICAGLNFIVILIWVLAFCG